MSRGRETLTSSFHHKRTRGASSRIFLDLLFYWIRCSNDETIARHKNVDNDVPSVTKMTASNQI